MGIYLRNPEMFQKEVFEGGIYLSIRVNYLHFRSLEEEMTSWVSSAKIGWW